MSTFGQELRRERELREISLREVSEATKISLRYLEALELNDFKDLPGGVFNRGFVRAYAQYIGVDPETMVTAYLAEEQSRGMAPAPVGAEAVLRGTPPAPSPAPARPAVPTTGSPLWLRWVLVAALVAAVGGGAFLVFRATRSTTLADAPPPEPAAHTDLQPTTPESGHATPSDRAPEIDDGTGETDAPPREAPDEDETSADEPLVAQRDAADGPGALDAPPATLASREPVAGPDPRIVQRPAASAPSTGSSEPRITIFVDRATDGRLNCDNRQIEILDGMRPGTSLRLSCRRFLIVDVGDAGALRVAVGGATPSALGLDGERIVARRIELRDEVAR